MVADNTPARIKELQPFIGIWKTDGQLKGGNSGKVSGTDSYEWLPGDFFILHKVDVTMDGKPAQAAEIIGWDKEKEEVIARSFDDNGNYEKFSMNVSDRFISIEGTAMRFKGSFSDDFSRIEGFWEQAAGNNWEHWMDITLAKQI